MIKGWKSCHYVCNMSPWNRLSYVVNFITKKHCECFIRRLFAVQGLSLFRMCGAFQVPIFYRIYIHKRPWDHVIFFFKCHLSLSPTLQFVQLVIWEDILSYLEVWTPENLPIPSAVMHTWLEDQNLWYLWFDMQDILFSWREISQCP